ncbi:hypothetical protein L4C33_11660 [Vibrio makurazakiensis]|uniref:hypothetical protein n=1 Tax=Vibrio makurazakiensis TaxID=2910250 RepID=UPI003D12567D
MFEKERSNKGAYVCSGLLVFACAGLGYSLHSKNISLESSNEQLAQAKTTVNSLNQEILEQNLAFETLMLEQTSEIERRDLIIVKQKKDISELISQLDYAKRSGKQYKSQYLAQKQATTLAKEEVNSQMVLEKQRLEQQTQEELKLQMNRLEGEYSSNALKEQNTERVDKLMSNFASLKVNLDVVNTCDKAYLERYGQAKSMLSHMRTYIQKNDMSTDYYHFVISNDAMISRKTRELCIEN